jgi:hypothetical protein
VATTTCPPSKGSVGSRLKIPMKMLNSANSAMKSPKPSRPASLATRPNP